MDIQEKIQSNVVEIKVTMARVEEHLKGINGALKRHDVAIEKNEMEIQNTKLSLAKIAALVGGSTVVATLANQGFQKLLGGG